MRDMRNECYSYTHKRDVSGNCHIACVEPDARMTGSSHGIKKGWFVYPILFDPVWKTRLCENYESQSSVNRAISQPTSPATGIDSQG